MAFRVCVAAVWSHLDGHTLMAPSFVCVLLFDIEGMGYGLWVGGCLCVALRCGVC